MSILIPTGYMLLADAMHEIGRQLFPGIYAGDQVKESIEDAVHEIVRHGGAKADEAIVDMAVVRFLENPAARHLLKATDTLLRRLIGTPPKHKDAIPAMLLAEIAISPNPYPLPPAFWNSRQGREALATSRAVYHGNVYERRWAGLPIEGIVIVPRASILPNTAAEQFGAAAKEPRGGGRSRQSKPFWNHLVTAIRKGIRFDVSFPEWKFDDQLDYVMKQRTDAEWKRLKLPKNEKMRREAFKEAIPEAIMREAAHERS
jgi:hypothetical protein